MSRVRARATVRVVLEVDATGGGWGHDAQVAQVFQQARDTAIETLRRLVGECRGIRIVGEPWVQGVAFDEKKPGDE